MLFPLLPAHLQPLALFMVHTGVRDEECCGLRWDWEQEVDELGVSVFVIPADASKNGIERVVVLNAVAHKVIEEQRAKRKDDCFWVFPYRGARIQMMNNTGWQAARKAASALYKAKFDKECPRGFRTLHVHDLRHTFGRRLRAMGVSNETRQDLLGHKNGNITTHLGSGAWRALTCGQADRIGRIGAAFAPGCLEESGTWMQSRAKVGQAK